MEKMSSEKITVSRKSNEFGTKLLSLQQRNKFCDATLIVNEERIAVHKNVLAASSDYFENVFVESELNEIYFRNVDKEALKILIDFCYKGTIVIEESLLKEVINMANVLSLFSFIESCAKTLKSRLNIKNSISTWKISQTGHSEDLKLIAFEYIKKNFEKVSKLPEFLTLEYSDMHDLLSSNMDIHPMIIYEVLKKWINHDTDSRLKNLNDLLTFVPLSCLPHNFLISEPTSMCDSNYSCVEKFLAALEKQRNDQFRNCNICTLLAIGEESKKRAKKIEVYDFFNQKWVFIEEMDVDYRYEEFRSLLLDDKLMMIGGYGDLTNVNLYDLKTGMISTLPSLIHGRCRSSLVQVEDKIYAISGNVQCVERYDPISRSWSHFAPMQTPRINCEAVAYKNKIYVMGGEDNDDNYLSWTECYDPSTDTWQYCSSMNEERAFFTVAVIGKYFYAVGGKNSSGKLKSVERYDTTINQWTMIRSSNYQRYLSAAGNLNDQLIIAGGKSDRTNVEIYDEINDRWNPMPSLSISRYNFNLISIPLNLAEHLLYRRA